MMSSLRRFARERGVTRRGVPTPLLLVRLRIWSGPELWGTCTTTSMITMGVTQHSDVSRCGFQSVLLTARTVLRGLRARSRPSSSGVPPAVRGYRSSIGHLVAALFLDALAGDDRPIGRLSCGRYRQVAVRFDDGSLPYTSQMLDVIRRFDLPGTFFVVGGSVAAGANVLKRAFRIGLRPPLPSGASGAGPAGRRRGQCGDEPRLGDDQGVYSSLTDLLPTTPGRPVTAASGRPTLRRGPVERGPGDRRHQHHVDGSPTAMVCSRSTMAAGTGPTRLPRSPPSSRRSMPVATGSSGSAADPCSGER